MFNSLKKKFARTSKKTEPKKPVKEGKATTTRVRPVSAKPAVRKINHKCHKQSANQLRKAAKKAKRLDPCQTKSRRRSR